MLASVRSRAVAYGAEGCRTLRGTLSAWDPQTLLEGYDQALSRFRLAAPHEAKEPAQFALFETLEWGTSLDQRIAEEHPSDWQWPGAVADGDVVVGLRLARTRVHHQWAVAFDSDGSRSGMLGHADFTRIFGARQADSVLHDAAETFFQEGGARLYVSRVVGPNPVAATRDLMNADATPAATLRVAAKSVGAWGNELTVEVSTTGVTAGSFVLIIRRNGTEVERSPELADETAAIAWGDTATYVTVTDLAGAGDPAAAAAAALAGGTDDRANAGDAQWAAALDRFGTDLGPGQVSMPGQTTQQRHVDTLAHAAARNRVGLLDLQNIATASTLRSAALALRTAAATNARFGGAFAPWAVIPGIAQGTTRTVPYSAVQAGLEARRDGQGLSPNVPAAGYPWPARYAIRLAQWGQDAPLTEADRASLNDAGVNVARLVYGQIETYGVPHPHRPAHRRAVARAEQHAAAPRDQRPRRGDPRAVRPPRDRRPRPAARRPPQRAHRDAPRLLRPGEPRAARRRPRGHVPRRRRQQREHPDDPRRPRAPRGDRREDGRDGGAGHPRDRPRRTGREPGVSLQYQGRVSAVIAGISTGPWDSIEGGDVIADDTKHYDGGTPVQRALGGRATVDNVTLTRRYDPPRDQPIYNQLKNKVGRGDVSLSVQDYDQDENVFGTPKTFTGKIIRLGNPQLDSNSGDVRSFEIEISCNGVVS
jgi:hypothetical protein